MSLIIDNLFFGYPKGSGQVLKGVTAEFQPGRISAVTGKNGCGKSTLLRNIVGLLRPSAGGIYIDGEDALNMSVAEIARHAGCVLQNPSCQIFELTVHDEMAYGLINRGLSGEELESRIMEFLTYFELEKHMEEFPGNLSKGEKQRLVLAEILAMDPRYVLLDEPTASLDMVRRKQLGDYLRKIADRGVGVIVVTHDYRFIEHYADVVLEMQDGRFV